MTILMLLQENPHGVHFLLVFSLISFSWCETNQISLIFSFLTIQLHLFFGPLTNKKKKETSSLSTWTSRCPVPKRIKQYIYINNGPNNSI